MTALLLAGCAGEAVTTASPQTTSSPTSEPTAGDTAPPATPTQTAEATPTPEPTPQAREPTEPGQTAWFELTLQGTGQITQGDSDEADADIHEGYVFRAGTLGAGQAVRLELPEHHAFADAPRRGLILVGSDDESASEVLLVDASSGETETVLSNEAIVWGGSLSPDVTEVYYVPVDRGSMTDAGLWRLPLDDGAEPEQLIEQVAPGPYDFASQLRFAWSPVGEHLIAQYCNRQDCLTHVVQAATGESRLHDADGIFHLRGATDTEYVADAIAANQRSGILAIDMRTLEVRVLAEEWGVSEVHRTVDGPYLVYFAPDQPTREMALVGVALAADRDPFIVYEDRATDTPPAQDFHPNGTGYEAPQGWILLWPGSPGPDREEWDPRFVLLDLLSGEEQTFPYEVDEPR